MRGLGDENATYDNAQGSQIVQVPAKHLIVEAHAISGTEQGIEPPTQVLVLLCSRRAAGGLLLLSTASGWSPAVLPLSSFSPLPSTTAPSRPNPCSQHPPSVP